ncbi:MAG: imelysin family protein [Hyphomicrobiaceae bacterium]
MMKQAVRAAFVFGLFAVIALGVTAEICAADDAHDVTKLPTVFAEKVTGPRLSGLKAAFVKQAEVWEEGCQSQRKLREAFDVASDAWAQMEMFRSGPLSRQSRQERIFYWPDPRNAISRGLNALLSGSGEEGLKPEEIAGASVAVQGLPVLERLLYGGRGSVDEKATLTARQCAVGTSIARNLRTIATNALAEWTAPETGDLEKIKSASAKPDEAKEAAAAVLGDIATGIRLVEDRKMPPIYGGKGVVPNPKSAESWRSKRSERDIALNLEALAAALKVVEPFAPEAAAAANEKLADAAAALAGPPDPNRAVTIIAAINNAKYYVIDVLPGELGLTLGFNSMDGD